MHSILTPGAVTNERPGKWSCDEIKLRVHQGSKWVLQHKYCSVDAPNLDPKCCENQQKKTFFTRRFLTTSQQKCSILRPLLSSTFPQEFWISKIFGHPTSGSGGKIGLKIYHAKRDRQTDIHTNIHTTDIATTRSNRPSGPIRWKSRIRETPILSTDSYRIINTD